MLADSFGITQSSVGTSNNNVIAVVSEYVIEMKFKSVHLFSQYGAQLRNSRYDL